ncbi:MAG: hypothetical protein M3179_05905 [Actinomycetota bacterium]|nr:hypothetical protein [Actinomycetota bacterium]
MIGFILFGVVVGIVRLLTPGRQHLSIWATLLLGVGGSVVGGVVANALRTAEILDFTLVGLAVAVVAAVAVIGIGETLAGLGRSRSRR